jgi:hypothetical protein
MLVDDLAILEKHDELNDNDNYFEITGINNAEIKHSNFLRWLFDQKAGHGLGYNILRLFFTRISTLTINNENGDTLIEQYSKIEQSDSFEIRREWEHIDLLLLCHKKRFAVAIENKIYAKESEHQLSDYQKVLEREYPKYKRKYIFLTLNGDLPSDLDNWLIANYRMIYDSIVGSLSLYPNIPLKYKIIIEDYLLLIRRKYIMNKDDDLVKTAREIYGKHKAAIDFIVDWKLDKIANVQEQLETWIVENQKKYNIYYDKQCSQKGWLRFTTKYINGELPRTDGRSDSWGNGFRLMYELVVSENSVVWQATVSDKNDIKVKKILDSLSNDAKSDSKSSGGSRWAFISEPETIFYGEDLQDEENLSHSLDVKMNQVMEKIKALEDLLKTTI